MFRAITLTEPIARSCFRTRALGIDAQAAAAGRVIALGTFVVPDTPAGVYQVAVRTTRPVKQTPRVSNQLALVVAPVITTALPVTIARDSNGSATVALDCLPAARPEQRVSLLLGTQEVIAQPFTVPTTSLVFAVENAPPGDHLVRLRVDGVESAIVDHAAQPPVFFNYRITIT